MITPWLSETIERLGAVGIEVEVLAPSYRGLGEQMFAGARVHRFRYAPAPLETLTHDQTTPDRLRERPLYLTLVPGYLLAGTLAAVRLARSGRFDVVHAFWPLPHGLFGLAARRLAGVPLVSTFFGVELTWMRRRLAFLAPLVRWIIRGSDAVTVISSHTAAEVRRLVPAAEARIIPFGAAVEPTAVEGATSSRRAGGVPAMTQGESPPSPPGANPAAGEEAHPAAGTSVAPHALLFVGRLVERKGVHVLLRAIASLPGRAARLRVVGDGPERPRLEELARSLGVADRVEFTGVVDSAELRRELQRCDALVLPAVEDAKGDVEGLGVVLIEALQHGKPVIASASGGIPDIVEDGRTGLLVPPGEPEALARAIVRLRDDPGLAERLAAEGRRHVEERFSWERIVKELGALYAEVAAREAA